MAAIPPAPPIVGCAVLRWNAGDDELLLGSYPADHPRPYLRNLQATPGGKFERLPPFHRPVGVLTGGLYCRDCGITLSGADPLPCPQPKPWEQPLDAALRELREECGTVADLEPHLSESFRATVHGHDLRDAEVHAFLFLAGPGFAPRDVAGERVGAWTWRPVQQLPGARRMTPLTLMILARFGLRPGRW